MRRVLCQTPYGPGQQPAPLLQPTARQRSIRKPCSLPASYVCAAWAAPSQKSDKSLLEDRPVRKSLNQIPPLQSSVVCTLRFWPLFKIRRVRSQVLARRNSILGGHAGNQHRQTKIPPQRGVLSAVTSTPANFGSARGVFLLSSQSSSGFDADPMNGPIC